MSSNKQFRRLQVSEIPTYYPEWIRTVDNALSSQHKDKLLNTSVAGQKSIICHVLDLKMHNLSKLPDFIEKAQKVMKLDYDPKKISHDEQESPKFHMPTPRRKALATDEKSQVHGLKIDLDMTSEFSVHIDDDHQSHSHIKSHSSHSHIESQSTQEHSINSVGMMTKEDFNSLFTPFGTMIDFCDHFEENNRTMKSSDFLMMFPHHKRITHVKLNINNIRTIIQNNNQTDKYSMLTMFESLLHLDLSVNLLESFDQKCIPARYLIELNLSHNMLTTLELSNMQNLKLLNVNRCQLTSIELRNIPNLRSLHAQHNKLTTLMTIDPARSLKFVDLKNNHIEEVYELLSIVTSVETLKLTNNKINMDQFEQLIDLFVNPTNVIDYYLKTKRVELKSVSSNLKFLWMKGNPCTHDINNSKQKKDDYLCKAVKIKTLESIDDISLHIGVRSKIKDAQNGESLSVLVEKLTKEYLERIKFEQFKANREIEQFEQKIKRIEKDFQEYKMTMEYELNLCIKLLESTRPSIERMKSFAEKNIIDKGKKELDVEEAKYQKVRKLWADKIEQMRLKREQVVQHRENDKLASLFEKFYTEYKVTFPIPKLHTRFQNMYTVSQTDLIAESETITKLATQRTTTTNQSVINVSNAIKATNAFIM